MALDARNGGPVAAYREQTVEIALGPKGAFENANVGILTRRVAADRVVSAVPRPRGRPKPPREPKTPRVVELLRNALEWEALLESGGVPNQAAIAHRQGITRARVTQVMGMLRLAPEIQQHILSMPDAVRRPAITERALRPIAQIENTRAQLDEFQKLLSSPAASRIGDCRCACRRGVERPASASCLSPHAGFRPERHVERTGAGQLDATETGFTLTRGPDTVRAPDIAFVSRARLPDPGPLGFPGLAPNLVVEVLSPDDRPAEVLAKVADRLSAGCQLVWVMG